MKRIHMTFTAGAYRAAAEAAERRAGEWLDKASRKRGAARRRCEALANGAMRAYHGFSAKARKADKVERAELRRAIEELGDGNS